MSTCAGGDNVDCDIAFFGDADEAHGFSGQRGRVDDHETLVEGEFRLDASRFQERHARLRA